MFGYVGLLENILFDIKMVKGQMDLVRFDFCFFFFFINKKLNWRKNTKETEFSKEEEEEED